MLSRLFIIILLLFPLATPLMASGIDLTVIPVDPVRISGDIKQIFKDSGMGFQWEGREVLPIISKEYPEWAYIASESECGRDTFDWPAAEHTFELINHYLANGCNEYTFWNVILADKGESPWGWRQNALIRVDSSKREATLTPEYYAASHYSQFLPAGSEIISVQGGQTNPIQLLAGRNPEGKLVIVAGNFSDESRKASVAVGKKYLNLELAPHSFNTYIEK